MVGFTLRQLHYFVATCEAGSIALAAEREYISASAVSAAIAHLEEALGVQLFVRQHAQGVVPTNQGRALLAEARALLRQADDLERLGTELAGVLAGRLRVGCLVTLAATVVPRVLPLARAAVAGPRLWVADRQFCDLDQPARFCAGDDHYLIRFSKKTGFHPDPSRPAQAGVDSQGRAFREEWGWMGAASQGPRRCYARRIWLSRPGEEDVILVTDLLEAGVYPAVDLLAVYLSRTSMAMLRPRRRAFSLGLRVALITLLVLALAGTGVVRAADRLSVVFLLDRSDSVPSSM